MFPHTVTVYHHEVSGGADVYSRYVVPGVYWYGGSGIAAADRGIQSSGTVTVITSPDRARDFDKKWNVLPGDKIVKGVFGEITSFRELNGKEVATVANVAENIIGSDVDNVTVTGKI